MGRVVSSVKQNRCKAIEAELPDGIDVCDLDEPDSEPVEWGEAVHAFRCTVHADEPVNPLWFALHYGNDGGGAASGQLRRRR